MSTDQYNDMFNQYNWYGLGSLMTGMDQNQKAYDLLYQQLANYYTDRQSQSEDRQRYYDIWDDVERAQAQQMLSDVSKYNNYNDKLMAANMEALSRRSLYYPLEEQSIQSAMDELGFESDQRNRIKSMYWPYEEKALQSATKDLQEQEDLRKMRYETTYPAMQEYAAEVGKINPEAYADQAGTDVQQAYANTMGQTVRNASRMGINPNSGAFAQTMADNANSQALALAGGRNAGRQQGTQAKLAGLQSVVSMGSFQAPTSTGSQVTANFGSKTAGTAGLSTAASGGLRTGLTNVMNPMNSSSVAGMSYGWRTQPGSYPSYAPLLAAGTTNMGRYKEGLDGMSSMTKASDAYSAAEQQNSFGLGDIGSIIGTGLKVAGTGASLGWW
ncbi:MAG: hypothetical protein AAGU21_01080 [Solidesulfovibrio sp.]|uniref:hypothetical protein n=1 Tax=Solidesulfovibrio sp. TaxID=2910990 RepID=UPI002B1FA84A|nr:hypothetical protein [Solidesulfovibrio sp.]MEA4857913.1 hypothetical protein [Solidesulfovibrio sp.]